MGNSRTTVCKFVVRYEENACSIEPNRLEANISFDLYHAAILQSHEETISSIRAPIRPNYPTIVCMEPTTLESKFCYTFCASSRLMDQRKNNAS